MENQRNKETFINLIKTRRSQRKFTNETISNDIVLDILQASIQAPSSKDKQNWSFVILRNDKKKEFIKSVISEHFLEQQNSKSKVLELPKILKINGIEGSIEGRLLDKKQSEELQREIESYYTPDGVIRFGTDNTDIRNSLFNYENPIAEKTINGINFRIATGLVRNKRQTYLLYANGKIIGEFYSVQDAKKIVNHIEDHLIKKMPSNIELNEDQKDFDTDYKKWKKKNVALRGIRETSIETKINGVYGSFGKGLYTVPFSNKSMAKQYGQVYFVLNAIPKNPKVVQSLNDADMLRQNLVFNFCKKHNQKYSLRFFDENTSMEKEMLELGYDGLIIKGREMVNYAPKNIIYFKSENELISYYNTL